MGQASTRTGSAATPLAAEPFKVCAEPGESSGPLSPLGDLLGRGTGSDIVGMNDVHVDRRLLHHEHCSVERVRDPYDGSGQVLESHIRLFGHVTEYPMSAKSDASSRMIASLAG